MHLQEHGRRLLLGRAAGKTTSHPSVPEVIVRTVGAIPSPCRRMGALGRTDARSSPPLSFSAYVTRIRGRNPHPTALPLFRTFFFLNFLFLGGGWWWGGASCSRCSARFPRVLGPPLPPAICHLPPLPARVLAERGDKGAGAAGPAPPAAPLPRPRAASPGRRAATCGTPGSFPPARPGAGGSGAAGPQQMGCGARRVPAPSPSPPCPRLPLPCPSPGLARGSPAEVWGERGCGPGGGRCARESTMAVSPKSASFPC